MGKLSARRLAARRRYVTASIADALLVLTLRPHLVEVIGPLVSALPDAEIVRLYNRRPLRADTKHVSSRKLRTLAAAGRALGVRPVKVKLAPTKKAALAAAAAQVTP